MKNKKILKIIVSIFLIIFILIFTFNYKINKLKLNGCIDKFTDFRDKTYAREQVFVYSIENINNQICNDNVTDKTIS